MKSKFDPKKHHRKSIRLKEYDYSRAGAYYVTIVTFQRECLFGEIVNGEMKLSPYGEIVQKWWNEILNHFSNVELGIFVIMPNHVHGIIFITERRDAVFAPRDNPNFNKMETIGFDKEIMEQNKIMNQDFPMELGGETPPLRTPTLGQVVAYFKYQSTKEMNTLDNKGVVTKFWQRNYYEHVIRNQQGLKNKKDYIEANPMLWDEDDENPMNIKL